MKMAQLRGPKTGRRASPAERHLARNLVVLFRQAQNTTTGKLCVNPTDAVEDQVWLDGNDPEYLLRVLEDFSETGSFGLVGPMYESIRNLPLRIQYRRGRDAGLTHQSVVEQLALEHNFSTRTIERKISTDKS